MMNFIRLTYPDGNSFDLSTDRIYSIGPVQQGEEGKSVIVLDAPERSQINVIQTVDEILAQFRGERNLHVITGEDDVESFRRRMKW
jgi:hypothetical protein